MIAKIKCGCCGSENLSLISMLYGKGTERGFKCNNCGEELNLDEVIFDEVFLINNSKRVQAM